MGQGNDDRRSLARVRSALRQKFNREMSDAAISLKDKIHQEAIRLGFIDCGFSKVRALTEHENIYNNWIEQGQHASMYYMERNTEKRIHPAQLLDGAKTVISFLYNYYSPEKFKGSPLKIAKYAYGKDYHDVIKDKLSMLDRFIKDLAGDVNQRGFVDSAPVLERAWAQNSGLGWIGKNSCLISRKHGSFFFIAEIITSLEFDAEQTSVKDYCGSCQKCIDACPTNAITEKRTINSNRCISYQTIENRGDIPSQFFGKMQDYIFGCDICQDVCPWNKKSSPHNEPLFSLKSELQEMSLINWQNMDEERYKQLFKGSPIKRTKFSGLKRNIDKASSHIKD